jgi:hypothetical protein
VTLLSVPSALAFLLFRDVLANWDSSFSGA